MNGLFTVNRTWHAHTTRRVARYRIPCITHCAGVGYLQHVADTLPCELFFATCTWVHCVEIIDCILLRRSP
jgi:hypothetical protein